MNAPPATEPRADLRCYHCGDLLAGVKIVHEDEAGQARNFCCEGCRTAYRIITAGGLDGYYRHREEFGGRPQEAEVDAADLYDLHEAQLPDEPNGHKRVILRVGGIHCASCVWLNEKILGGLPGVAQAEVRLATRRAHIEYDPARVRLRELAAAAARVGYHLSPLEANEAGVRAAREDRDLLTRLGVAGFFAGNMMLVSVALYAGYFDSMERMTRNLLHLVSFLFAAPVLLYSAGPFFRGAYHSLRYRVPGMDLLLSAGISLAFGYSVYAALAERGEVYFDSITFVVFAVLTGRFLENRLRSGARDEIENLRAGDEHAVYLIDANGARTALLSSRVRAGMTIEVPAGVPLPADGSLSSDDAELDESLLTGEYRPVPRRRGDPLLSGARPVGAALRMQTARDANASTLARLHDLVDESLNENAPASRLATRTAQWFVVFVLSAAALTFAYWSWQSLPELGVHATIALLIVACPCALSLAIPMARVTALSAARRRGILFKNGTALETLARTELLVLDKTGTLTVGHPRVTRVVLAESGTQAVATKTKTAATRDEYLRLARTLQTRAAVRHPVAEAFRAARTGEQEESNHDDLRADYLPGRGVRGADARAQYLLGSRNWMIAEQVAGLNEFAAGDESGNRQAPGETDTGELPVYLARSTGSPARGATQAGYELIAVFFLTDELKPGAAEVVRRLAARMRPVLLSGDLAANVRRTAESLGIEEGLAERSPEEKREFVRDRRRNSGGGTLCMVGDGINDAAALAEADCGVSFANAADISLYSADVLLLGGDLALLEFLFALSRKTRRKILQNLGLSFAYNLILIPLAFSGAIVPVLGAIFMALSSLTVVANSLLLGRGWDASGGSRAAA